MAGDDRTGRQRQCAARSRIKPALSGSTPSRKVGHGVIVQVEADIGVLPALTATCSTAGSGDCPGNDSSRGASSAKTSATLRVWSSGQHRSAAAATLGIGLRIENRQVGECAGGEELPSRTVSHSSFDATFGLYYQLHPVLGYRRQRPVITHPFHPPRWTTDRYRWAREPLGRGRALYLNDAAGGGNRFP